eukprot:GGOE01028529.1.p1 GENE.GGOE01028529.1~~GGOE01028529.1.p1  ORF type:complete len:471 (-),score=122.40 GGOE01028529.1:2207-3598(-)
MCQPEGTSAYKMNGVPTRILGRGRFGVVVQIHNPLLNRSYALKVIALAGDERQVEQALNECRVLAQLDHPNIIRSYGCWTESSLQSLASLAEEVDPTSAADQPCCTGSTMLDWTSCSGPGAPPAVVSPSRFLFLQMELCDGTLADWIEACSNGVPVVGGTRCRADKYLRLFHQLCRGLQYLHDNHYIHNDLKPANVCLLNGNVKLSDFGLSSGPFAAAGVGTPLYSAPEALRSPSSDVFSLGLILYELSLCGARLSAEQRRREVQQVRATGETPRPMEHATVIRQMLAENPNDRLPISGVMSGVFQDPEVPPSPLTPVDPEAAAAGEWAAFVDMLVDAAVLSNAKGIVVAMNDMAGELFGYEGRELLGHSVNQLMPKSYARNHDAHMQRYVDGTIQRRLIGKPRIVPICCKDGRSKQAEICLGEMEQDGEHYFLACFRPVSEAAAPSHDRVAHGGCPFARSLN